MCAVMSSYGDSIYIDDDSDEEVQCLQQNDIEDDTEEVQLLHETRNESENPTDSHNALVQELKKKKLMTTVVDSLEAAYELYCEYAHSCGFSVRKRKQYYVKGTQYFSVQSKILKNLTTKASLIMKSWRP
jgi:hypothetical protein